MGVEVFLINIAVITKCAFVLSSLTYIVSAAAASPAAFVHFLSLDMEEEKKQEIGYCLHGQTTWVS